MQHLTDDDRIGQWSRKNPSDWFKMDGWAWAKGGYTLDFNPYDPKDEAKQHNDFIEGWHAYHRWNRRSLIGAWAVVLGFVFLFSVFAHLTA
ncbi:MAG: hypothetical protein COB05_19000 [Marinobacter sp.]|nr:MAG: hypothetical protein COB05_19000 [Marinobacter sp.]